MPLHCLVAIDLSRELKPGRYFDGGGLFLQVYANGSRCWCFRYMLRGRAREMGLGSFNSVPLAEARKRAAEYRLLKSSGADPIEVRREKRQQATLKAAQVLTFKQCAESYIAAHRPSWRSLKHAGQWESTLETHAYPVFGNLPVQAVDTALVMKVLKPVWAVTPSTGARLRGRIECILDWAKAMGHRHGDNSARWRGHLDQALPKVSRVRKVKHHSALPYAEIGAFVEALLRQEGMAAWALRFLILTATRTSETLHAKWDEIDMQQGIWTIPAERMKAGKAHRVPLPSAVMKLLKTVPRDPDSAYLFPGAKRGAPLSNMALLVLLRRMGYGHITAHGFRSSFRDFAAELGNHPHEVAELALAHAIGNKVEAAYRRGDLFEKRRRLMNDWAMHCARVVAPNVIKLNRCS
jgi:integrase